MKEFLKAFSSAGASDAYKYLGSFSEKGKTVFRVWAPNATEVSLEEYVCYTTEETEKLELMRLTEKLGGNIELAIKQLAESKREK